MSPSRELTQRGGGSVNSLRYEQRRLSTFSVWPSSAQVSGQRLARAGFYCVCGGGGGGGVVTSPSKSDSKWTQWRVQCFSCSGTLDASQWQAACGNNTNKQEKKGGDGEDVDFDDDDDGRDGKEVMLLHRRLFPECAFVNECSDNVPLLRLVHIEQHHHHHHRHHHLQQQQDSLEDPELDPEHRGADVGRVEDSGYGSTGSSHSPVSSQDSAGSLSPRTSSAASVRLATTATTTTTTSNEAVAVDDQELEPERRHRHELATRTVNDDIALEQAESTAAATGSPTSSSSQQQQQQQAQGRRRRTGGGPVAAWRDATYMNREAARRRSFIESGWYSAAASVSVEQLARAGFVSMHDGDKVQCVFCRGMVGNWEPDDVALDEHRRLFPLCPFVRGCDVGNVPIELDDMEADEHDDDDDEMRFSYDDDDAEVGDVEVDEERESGRRDGDRAGASMPPSLVSTSGVTGGSGAGLGTDEVGFRLDYRTSSEPENARANYRLTRELNIHTTPATAVVTASTTGSSAASVSSSEPAAASFPTTSGGGEVASLSSLGVSEHHAPAHPSYATVQARLRSFQHWPPALAQKPRQMAEAGFFYIGLSDHVKCFHCDGGLRNWVPGDDPWVEHARWLSTCGFMRLIKGPDFINAALRDHSGHEAGGQMTASLSASSGQRGDTHHHDDDEEDEQSTTPTLRFSEQQIDAMMKNAICETAIQLGLSHDAVKRALRQQLAATGAPFSDVSAVLSMAAAPHQQSSGEDADTTTTAQTGVVRGAATCDDDNGDPAPSQQHPTCTATELGASGVVLLDSQMSRDCRLSDSDQQQQQQHCSSSASTSSSPVTVDTEPPAEQQSSLVAEYQRLKDQKQCKVCMDAEVGVVFLPCGHLITCVNCAPALSHCALCRQSIRGTVRTYLS